MPEIKERPILFSGPMVRVILEGRKTVTRRVVKPLQQPELMDDGSWFAVAQSHRRYGFGVSGPDAQSCANALAASQCCPYGKPCDRLWVRETFIDLLGTGVEHRPDPDGPLQRYAYAADYRPGSHSDEARKDFGLKHRPSIHMPRAASRILLEITDVRVERLQDITDDQAEAEGCFFTDYGQQCFHGGTGWKDVGDCPAQAGHQQRNGWAWDKTTSHEQCLLTPRFAFANLWNATGGDWDANLWVWAITFRRVEQ
ncbi:hypothetical protein [Pseudomonas sp. MWU12-2345]|uniref:hypothetical protein n=1 Tax=Pseudomonas sp. MWU12-2345 TaxID=2928689 RepID=UPI00200BB2F6|nr:hypothetical protein [Pseudomonas sp. MWU12-2345]